MKENLSYAMPDYEQFIDTLLNPESFYRVPLAKKVPARIGIQSRGEMANGALDYFNALGWNTRVLNEKTRVLSAQIGPGLTLFKLRAPTMLDALREGKLDMAILGADIVSEDYLSERPSPIVVVKRLGFGDCRFCMGFPYNSPIGYPLDRKKLVEVLRDAVIATSLPNILKVRLRREGIPINENKIIVMDGSIEVAISLYGARAIADRVSSGNTMLANDIRPELTLDYFPGAFLVASKKFLEIIGTK